MVVPGRIADPYLRFGEVTLEEVGTDFQRARATHGLHGGYTAALHCRMIGTEQQRLDCLAIAAQTFHRQVQRRFMRLAGHALLGFADRGQLRHHACGVVIQTDTQVDLVGARVGLEGFHQGENRIAGIGIDMFEHSVQLLGSGQIGKDCGEDTCSRA
ncbi:hypothetical protein D9M71_662100 [compost metagenome]